MHVKFTNLEIFTLHTTRGLCVIAQVEFHNCVRHPCVRCSPTHLGIDPTDTPAPPNSLFIGRGSMGEIG